MTPLKQLTIRGFKSIRSLENFELRPLNILIGANGAGKSNFLAFLEMLHALEDQRLQVHVQEHDGPDALLYGSRRITERIDIELDFARFGYGAALIPAGARLIFESENMWSANDSIQTHYNLGSGHEESHLQDANTALSPALRLIMSLGHLDKYSFGETSSRAQVRQAQSVRDNFRLDRDAGNLAPFLRRIREQHPASYTRILETIRLAAPFFDDFAYRKASNDDRVELEWLEKRFPDTPRSPRALSDGTLRFIALASLLLQPTELQTEIIVIDEPELGLHPYALGLLGAMLRQCSEQRQIIVSTQSAELLTDMKPEDIVVVDREDDASCFKRLDAKELGDWLQDYSLADLWRSNVLGGRPRR